MREEGNSQFWGTLTRNGGGVSMTSRKDSLAVQKESVKSEKKYPWKKIW